MNYMIIIEWNKRFLTWDPIFYLFSDLYFSSRAPASSVLVI